MKLRDLLVELLSENNPDILDREVVLSSDPEGNKHSPVCGVSLMAYVPHGVRGEVYLEKLTDEDRAHGYTEEDVVSGDAIFTPCILLHPEG